MCPMTGQTHPHPKCHDCKQFFKCDELPPCSRPAPPADALDHSSCAVENCSVRYRAGGSQSNGEWVCSEADHTPIKKLKVCPAWLKAHDAAIRKATIYELLKDLGYGCPGGDVTPICEMCKANQYCTELRHEGAP